MARLSGLQRQVLALYRTCLREAGKKPIVSNYLAALSKAEFRKNSSVSKKDFGAIEYLLRKGQRQLEMYSAPGIRNIR
ncbi:hypothetical protein M747DRAFT_231117 [Aspergillus niger ATCC 13496]|uniref:Contig An18c0220, genomic contig n=3 Tax=Aspergillus niger TaxID=5061 RepID=A2RBG7_ASPNC|nr:uncharacterized protein An18g06660 [Aspergillus niger]RDH23402.1 hypothetical protein M747DRAFT_231117 [Aspergillus niger ATCC 13496]CAK43373.1 unnamed protein product [Aspergillus niger]